MITIVDYGIGNVGAIENMLDVLGLECEVTADPARVRAARKVILPGVGAFDRAMSTLRATGLVDALNEVALQRRVPVLGVCLGMQVLARGSEEGLQPGLGWIAADVRRLQPAPESGLKVPHIGWYPVRPARETALFPEASGSERFYFVHSYALECDDAGDVAATVEFAGARCCAVAKGNIYGVQFHPEKSHRYGMRLFKTFGGLR
jgi:imidazole glycerol-phosphate synthase subunit HisH